MRFRKIAVGVITAGIIGAVTGLFVVENAFIEYARAAEMRGNGGHHALDATFDPDNEASTLGT